MSSTVYCLIKYIGENLTYPTSLLSPREIGMRHGVDTSLSRIKSTGTDDGFKGDGASYGYSVVAVAHQMIAERTNDNTKLAPPPVIMNQRIRRNSKSLPASPQTSPKLLRKNPYFTNIIFGSSEAVDNNNENNSSIMRGSVEELGTWAKVKHQRFQNQQEHQQLFDMNTNKDSIVSATATMAHPQHSPLTRQLFTPSPPNHTNNTGSGQIVSLKAKPSHLREMNFWSPTSM